ncbi:MAG: cytochrome c4 [Gammaproteobacteria bacterium]|nr:cytochrome c4 [Gammaproteobacteria bacterium]NNC57476.1 cytochrome c4 [Woeseiaceae bacterium]NNL52025.1 cytochrome c4 [Woeseiaceae bacterium]
MKNMLALIFTLTGLALAAAPAHADSLVSGSADAGKAKALTCTACHGPEGNSASALWPNIAGQNAPYIRAQLMAFKNGSRKDPLMSSQAMLLSEQDMADLAVYFESLPAAAQSVADASLVARGEALYRGGDAQNGTAACMACHGPTGRGNPAAKYPALKGQHAAYTAKQLRDYAAETRDTDGKTRMMRDIAARLGSNDIKAVSSYVQGLK